ncbi:ribonucleotide-diphosphate reductase subunit alpha, partial [Escherichia coli]|nr:ribonucleotide-diphosphate reductase subunit alpha [Escherichia coli]
NRGIEENRVRHLDYGVMINRLMYRRLVRNENITLFSPHDVPGLYDAFFVDQDKFEELYLKYEADESIRKKSIPAVDLFSTLMQERASTGRVYIANVDHMNDHGAFVPEIAPVH